MHRLPCALLAVALVACGSGPEPVEVCVTAADCAGGERCVNGMCTAGRDAGSEAESDADVDPPMDAAPSDDAAPFDAAVACVRGADCGPGMFCDGTTCDGPGECAPRLDLDTCPDDYEPVCGCNGVTYANACEAASAGARVAADGPCACTSNDDCGADFFCAGMTCGGLGECSVRPELCPRFIDPVCGCDGVTYDNSCLAAARGVRVASMGRCACDTNEDCSPQEYCAGRLCDGPGVCTLKPTSCSGALNPVCGCDGRTYGNSCLAQQAGVRLDTDPRRHRCLRF